MLSLTAIVSFLLGLIVGSFLNVCILRIPQKQSIVLPSAHCPKCGHPLKAWENIPLFSYMFLRGKCAYCEQTISFQYPLVELAGGLLFLAVFLKFKWSFETPVAFFFVSILTVLAVIDLEHKLIPNKIILPGLGAGFFFLILELILRVDFIPLTGVSSSVAYPLIGLVLGGGLLLIPAMIKTDWMGGGDIKLAAFMGLFLGGYILLALLLGSLLSAVVGIILILFKKMGRKDTIAFGPFLALGSLITLFFGPQIFNFYRLLIR